MSSKAQGQFTIIDFNDAITLMGFIGSNLPKTQVYNPDNETFNPDWSTTNLVLTPSLYKAGTSTDIISSSGVQSVTWYEGNSGTAITAGSNYALSGVKSHILTVKKNVLTDTGAKDLRCKIIYIDDVTNLSLTYETSITISKVINGGGITDLIVTTPMGNVYKNDDVPFLTALAQLWRGSVIDTTNVTYQWYMMDATVTTDQGGGIGWKKLTNVANKYAGVTTNTLTLYASSVTNFATVKCIATDTSVGSGGDYVGTASFVDLSDPIQVVIQSSGGNIFKNGVGSTNLTAKLFRAGDEIDIAGTNGTYSWKKYNSDSTLNQSFGTKTGKTLAVGADDVDVKATFICEVDI